MKPSWHGERTFAASTEMQRRLHELVPGGAHTYSRGSDQYPEDMAPVIARGEGAHVQDVDGNWFVEYGMGLRSVTLGHAYAPVVEAVVDAARTGVSFSRPSVYELRAAEEFLAQVPGADMVKFAKNGSDVTTAAVKLARAATGRDLVALCRSQPFFSTDDWFIGSTEMDAGIPDAPRRLTVTFDYNDLASVESLLQRHPGRIACLILEAGTATSEPEPGFLQGLRTLADRDGFVLVFDEIITGMRWSKGGAQEVYGTTPDLSTWGKALGNGFAVSALAGRAGAHGARRPAHGRRPGLPAVHHARAGDHRVGRVPGGGGGLPAEGRRRRHGAAGPQARRRRQHGRVRARHRRALRGRRETLLPGVRHAGTTSGGRRRSSGRFFSRRCWNEASSGSRSSSPRRTPTTTSTGRSRRSVRP